MTRMGAPGGNTDPVREFRIEGPGLALIGALLLVALAGAFQIGRMVERRSAPPRAAAGAAGPGVEANAPLRGETEVDEGDVFDRAPETQLEPSRQAVVPATPGEAAERPARTPAATPPAGAIQAEGGEFFVQVFAGRDEAAAAGLVRRLEGQGHPVVLRTEREGPSTLFKVRVGGFATRERAQQAAQKLQQQGYSGAWVTAEP